MVHDAGEVDVSALRHGVIFQRREELGLKLGHLTCNKAGDNCLDLPTE